jgi:pSer/pThr/pTyr-binding forkhead associated (FHA) protein
MVGRVSVLRDIVTGQEYPITSKALRVGRVREENDVVLNENLVSRYHATLWEQAGVLYVRDEGSTNGTMVDGQRIAEPVALQSGARVSFGGHEFVVEMVEVDDFSSNVAHASDNVERKTSWPPILIGMGVIFAILLAFVLRGTGGQARTLPSSAATHTATAVVTPTATITPAPTLTTTPLPTATPTSQPAPQQPVTSSYTSPSLLHPPDGSNHPGAKKLHLDWSTVGNLGQDDYYRIILRYSREGGFWQETGWSRISPWVTPEYLPWLIHHPFECEWYVEVVHVTDYDADGMPTDGVVISPPSETWSFVWQQIDSNSDAGDSGGGGSASPTTMPTATPSIRGH